ncbi:hypothetical protein [Flavobacterium cerinum]|uniref:Lipoprotein n=1 Tax=Flavobacterium cerinum TaxID=2502784 RepID=A0ABY5IU36_9FLAO|nr:hypothetical protein [Flavobacterium cerinum]UUC46350.1 hypothetical protein NOX80_03900 [Flavobacterium cerinum]
MRLVTLLAAVIITCTGCNCAQKKTTDVTATENKLTMEQQQGNPVFEYDASSRGFYRKIVLENKELRVTKSRGDQELPTVIKLSDTEWNEIMTSFKKLDLKTVSELKAPTEKRFYDGAAMANFTIRAGNETYTVPTFDHGFPPAAIEKIVNKLNELADKK